MGALKKNTEVDTFIGKKLKHIRQRHNLTQTKLGDLIGVSHQQIQQYETGESRISASTIISLSEIFNVPPSFFFDGFRRANAVKNALSGENLINTVRYKPLNILIVDNNDQDEFLLREAVEETGFRSSIFSLHDGDSAIEHLKTFAFDYGNPKRPDLIFIDINLPKTSGLDVLKFLKKNESTRDIITIVLTSSMKLKDLEESYKLFANGFIRKSHDSDNFQDNIRKVIAYSYSTIMLSMQYE
jgi:CheY-like chemotaxis protein/DNA-binding XRE family transcriptional regulator